MTIDGAHSIELWEIVIAPRYSLDSPGRVVTARNNRLELFRVIPNDSSLPGFAARWDDATQTIDIDPDPPECIDPKIWEAEKQGYRGHHTQTLTDSPREYGIEVWTPNGQVFKARCRLNIDIGLKLPPLAADPGIAVDAEVVRTKIGSGSLPHLNPRQKGG